MIQAEAGPIFFPIYTSTPQKRLEFIEVRDKYMEKVLPVKQLCLYDLYFMDHPPPWKD